MAFANRVQLQRPVHLILDFDATLTVRDTIHLLKEVPLHCDNRRGRQISQVLSWKSLEEAYLKDYNRQKEVETAVHHEISGPDRSFVDRAKAYSQMLGRRRIVEEQSMKRLEEWTFFRGATREAVCSAAEKVVGDGRLTLRSQWAQLMQMFTAKNDQTDFSGKPKLSIISLNWSETFIRQSLLSALKLEHQRQTELLPFIERDLRIYSCEIAGLDDTEGSSGRMRADVLGSGDKMKYLPAASQRSSLLYPDRSPDPAASYLVYVGDSSTDFDCLMAADTGIWLCPANDLLAAEEKCEQCFKPLNMRIRPINDLDAGNVAEDELVWAQDFEQIIHFLSRLAP